MEIRCGRVQMRGQDGLQVVFIQSENMADIYEFYAPEDMDYFVSLIRMQVAPEAILVEARDRSQLTVH